MRGLVDSHCHLDAAEFDPDRDAVIQEALRTGIAAMVVPAVERANFETVVALAGRYPACVAALGIHPMYVGRAVPDDLQALDEALARDRPVAVGEIGLDFFVDGLDTALQEFYFVEQLKLACKHDLPVILHVRRAQDTVLKYLRRYRVRGGIAHAFNGSRQQADAFIDLGFKLGFGGAMTWSRALRIRALAASLPMASIVLETDAPDIPPEWLGQSGRNTPAQLGKIARALAEIRGLEVAEIVDTSTRNVLAALPEMVQLCTPPQVLL